MSHFDRSTELLDESERPRKVGSRLADFGDRIARAFATERPSLYVSDAEPDEDPFFPKEPEQPWERIAARFPIAREGYDRATVDQYLSGLERELAQARKTAASEGAIAAEIDRVGEQTSAILKTAHDQAREITRQAKAEADRCIGQAASRAMEMTQAAEQRLRALDGETEAIWSERAQLIDDVRSVAASLMTLAEESARRFPPENQRTPVPGPPLPVPVADPVPSATAPTIASSQPMTAAAKAPTDDTVGSEPDIADC